MDFLSKIENDSFKAFETEEELDLNSFRGGSSGHSGGSISPNGDYCGSDEGDIETQVVRVYRDCHAL